MFQNITAIQTKKSFKHIMLVLVSIILCHISSCTGCQDNTGDDKILDKDKALIGMENDTIKERVVYKDKVIKENCFIVISKKNLSLNVYEVAKSDTSLVAMFPVCLSKNMGQKKTKGDMRTPECSLDNPFTICEIQKSSTWCHDFGDGRGEILAYGDWFLRLDTGFSGIGIHGSTNNEETVPGRESEGCIRLKDNDIIFLKEHYAIEGMKVIVKKEREGLWNFERKRSEV